MASKILVGAEVIITDGTYKRKRGIITNDQPSNKRQIGKKAVKIGEKTVWLEPKKLSVIESKFPTETLSASAPLRERERNTECKEESHTLTSAQESEQDSRFQQLDLVEYLNSQASVKEKSSAATSSASDSQELRSTQTCNRSPASDTTCTEESTSSPLAHHVNPLPEKVNGLEAQTSETASPQSLMLSADINPNLQPLKTSQDSLTVPTDQEQQCFTSVTSWENFTTSGTMQNGKLSAADGLAQFGEETDSLSLPRPGALSTGSSRVPGQTKFESKCKELGLIQKGEVADPEVLEEEFGLPIGWTNPSESRAATELLESEGRHLEIASIPDLQRSPSGESSICTASQSDNEYLEAANDDHKETCPECGAILPPPTSSGGMCCLYCDWELPELKLLEPGEQWVDTKLIVVGELQCRSKESQQHIEDLSSAMQTEDLWDWQRQPLIELWQEPVSGVVRCADGNHRTKAAIKADITRVYAIVHHGSLNDAIASSCTANADSVLPLTSQDHRRRTEIFLDLLDSCTDEEKLALLQKSKHLSDQEKNRGVWSVRVINTGLTQLAQAIASEAESW